MSLLIRVDRGKQVRYAGLASFDLLYSVTFLPVAVSYLSIRVRVGAFPVLQTIFPLSVESAPVRPARQIAVRID